MWRPLTISFLLAGCIAIPVLAQPAPSTLPPPEPPQAAPQEEFSTATVMEIVKEEKSDAYGFDRTVQTVRLRIMSGPETGKELQMSNGILNDREDMRLRLGETIVLDKQIKVDGSALYMIKEKYRIPGMLWLLVLFIALSIFFGGITGITSIIGLAVSIAILLWIVIPRIIAGSDPLTVSLVGCVLIAFTSLYLAHGFNKRTSIALLSTTVTLALAAIMDIAFVHAAGLFGMGSEESVYLQSGLLSGVDLRGLLLGGILIGCLGVLDDVTTAQTAAIDEIAKANPKMSTADLQRAGQSVGREHIASLINTLALAYVGASLPLLLLLKTQGDYPFWVTINGEFFAEEIIRTLVGSATLLVAVPVSTWFAAYFLQGGKGGKSHGHVHVH